MKLYTYERSTRSARGRFPLRERALLLTLPYTCHVFSQYYFSRLQPQTGGGRRGGGFAVEFRAAESWLSCAERCLSARLTSKPPPHLKSRRFPQLLEALRSEEEDSLVFALSKAILADERMLRSAKIAITCPRLYFSLAILQRTSDALP